MPQTSQTIRLGLLWHSMTSDNLGVGALTLAHIAILREAAAKLGLTPHFTILGWKDPRPQYFKADDIEVVELRMKDFIKPVGGLLSHLHRCDVVFDISAGDSFTDIYGTKRAGTMLAAKILTFVARRPLILAPQTIGPFERGWARRMALCVIRRARVAAVRDDLSADFLRSLGYSGDLIAASDVALRLPFERAELPPSDKLRVGLNVSGLLFNGGYTGGNMFGLRDSYADTIRRLVANLAARDDIDLHLVGHVISDATEVEDDYRVSQQLGEEFPGTVVAPKFNDPIEAKSYIAALDAFAGARMHACIAAFSSGVPVLPMAYSRKFAGLFGALGYETMADCREHSGDEIISRFEALLANRETVAAQMQQPLSRGLDRLARYEDAIGKVLTDACGGSGTP
ncbi:polysaccharide pyruvyl transferase family protein [Vannielia litorea]|uniref:polysaccharide pyruvyl transferase family protein n=1 Tax=Vannielia litorea TaxID=1217970 RepID=UPI001C977430|nr:polysaccharide pyruvyl transferase family protein [Vannielia litorea]MBY6155186.1 polysaccharide pyruvyl transferase family protein [Vannielia litorea]